MYKVKTNNKTSKKITNKVDFVNLDGFLMPSKKQYFICLLYTSPSPRD